MLAAGYLLKRIAPPPDWLGAGENRIEDICSVSACVNADVVDVQNAWQHNGFGLANRPDILTSLAAETAISVDGARLFYYTAYEREIASDGWSFDAASWRPRSRARSAGVDDAVQEPGDDDALSLMGYDVVVFGDYLEHSPLSCNSVAANLPVNEHCLLSSREEAIEAIDAGAFGGGCEEGVYTIFAVYRVG